MCAVPNHPAQAAVSAVNPAFISRQVVAAHYGFLDMKPPLDEALAVVCAGREHCRPDYGIARIDFPYACLEFVLRGRGELVLDGSRHALGPGSVFAYGPGIPHAIAVDPADPFVKYFVDFTGRQAAALLRKSGVPPGTHTRVSTPQRLMDDFETLIANIREDAPPILRRCAVFLEYLLLRTASSVRPPESHASPAFSTYLRCRLVLHERALALRSLDDLALACHVDKAYLCRLFRRFEGRSPHQCLLRLKLNQAAERLMAGNYSVKDVAAAVGFHDPYHFSRSFRRTFGTSPSAFVRGAHRSPQPSP